MCWFSIVVVSLRNWCPKLKGIVKALCYPRQPKNVHLEKLIALAHADGKRISKGSNVRVLEVLWSERCQLWVVIVEVV